jgi:hypothetical protein
MDRKFLKNYFDIIYGIYRRIYDWGNILDGNRHEINTTLVDLQTGIGVVTR